MSLSTCGRVGEVSTTGRPHLGAWIPSDGSIHECYAWEFNSVDCLGHTEEVLSWATYNIVNVYSKGPLF